MNKTSMYLIVSVVVIVIIVGGVLAYVLTSAKRGRRRQHNGRITAQNTSSEHSAGSISSPGPTLTLHSRANLYNNSTQRWNDAPQLCNRNNQSRWKHSLSL